MIVFWPLLLFICVLVDTKECPKICGRFSEYEDGHVKHAAVFNRQYKNAFMHAQNGKKVKSIDFLIRKEEINMNEEYFSYSENQKK